MDLLVASRFAEIQLGKYGLNIGGWTFRYNNNVKRFGVCKYEGRTIELSSQYALNNSEDLVQDTILHEIAHALAGFAAAHGSVWQNLAIRVGARPVACKDVIGEGIILPRGNYKGKCGCGMRFVRVKIPKGKHVCRDCRSPITWYYEK